MSDGRKDMMNAARDMLADTLELTSLLRVDRLKRLKILEDNVPVFDDIVAQAAAATEFPSAMLTFIMDEYALVKSSYNGVPVGKEPREIAFCNLAIENPCEPLIVEDAPSDRRFSNNPKVVGGALGTYAGMPIKTPDGIPIGALCVVDPHVRHVDPEKVEALKKFAAMVEAVIAQRALENQ